MDGVELVGIVLGLTSFLEAIAQSDEGVDFISWGLVLAVTSDGKEGADDVDVGDHAVIFSLGLAD